MEREQYEQIAVGAGLLAVIAAIAGGRLPRWLRVAFVVGAAAIIGGVGFYAYRHYSAPTTLTVAAGSLDGEASRLLSAVAAKMTAANAPVRLKVVDKGTSTEAA